MKSKEEIIDIEDFELEIKQLAQISNPIDSNFQAMVFDYMNKISGKFGKNPITDSRSDIKFRIHSIMYFAKLFWHEEQSLLTFLNQESQMDTSQKMILSDSLVLNQKAIFDSILYHLGSIYDYYASMVGYIYNNTSLKWNGLVSSARNESNSKIGEAQKMFIIKSHIEFVDSVFKHRSDLIHNSTSQPGFSYTHNLIPNIYSIKIITPYKFVNEFKTLKGKIGDKQISLKASLMWMLKYGFTNINKLLYGMKDELESLRKREKRRAIITDIRYPEGEASEAYWIKD